MTKPGFSVYARGGQWIVSFFSPKHEAIGKKPWREHRIPPAANVRTEAQATRYALANLERLQSGEHLVKQPTPKSPMGATFADVESKWLAVVKDRVARGKLKKSTMRAHEDAFKVLNSMLGAEPLDTFDVRRARRWVCDLAKRPRAQRGKGEPKPQPPISPSRVRNIFATAKLVVDDAITEGWCTLAANPLRTSTVIDELPAAELLRGPDVIYLTRETAERLLTSEGTDEFWTTVYLLALLTGMREEEIAALEWRDVDFETKMIDVTKSLDVHDGSIIVTPPKTKSGRRRIPMHHVLSRVLREWRDTWRVLIGWKPRPDDPLFPDVDGSRRTLHGAARRLRADLRRAGCPDKMNGHNIVFHSLRATFNTWLDRNGVPERVRLRLMGQSAGGVQKHYTAIEIDQLRAAVETIKLDLSAATVIALPVAANGVVSRGASRTPVFGPREETRNAARNPSKTSDLAHHANGVSHRGDSHESIIDLDRNDLVRSNALALLLAAARGEEDSAVRLAEIVAPGRTMREALDVAEHVLERRVKSRSA